MRGNNEIRINQATMIEALECWLRTQLQSGINADLVAAVAVGGQEFSGVLPGASVQRAEFDCAALPFRPAAREFWDPDIDTEKGWQP